MKLIISLLFIIIYINFIDGKLKDTSSCTSFINIQSQNTQSPCGQSLENACQSFLLANQTCNISQFDKVIYYFSPGTYNFANLDPFGIIVNKNIQILNQNYSKSETSTSVIFNLEGSLNSFFNINNYNSFSNDITNIDVNGITFINGFQSNTASVLVSNATGSYSFKNCVFENCLSNSSQSGGSISFLPTQNVAVTSNLTISNSVYQNTNSSDINGGFILIDIGNQVNLVIDSSTFINSVVTKGSIIYFKSYNKNSAVAVTNSIFSYNNLKAGYNFKSNCQVSISNVTFNQNNGGIGFGIFENNSKIVNSKFINNINSTSINFISTGNPGILISDCYFAENSNSDAMLFGDSCITISNTENVIINNCQFINNYAVYGAAMYLDTEFDGLTSITNSTFISNSAKKGAVFMQYTKLSFNGTNVFHNNYAIGGSAIYCTNSDIYINDDSKFSFINNTDTNDKSSDGVTCGSKQFTNECTVFGSLNICNSTQSSSENSSSKDNSSNSSKDNSSSSKENSSSSKENSSSSKENSNSSKENNNSSKENSNSDKENSNSSSDNHYKNKNKLSSGAKVAISFSVIIGFIGLVILTIFILRRNKLRKGYIPISS